MAAVIIHLGLGIVTSRTTGREGAQAEKEGEVGDERLRNAKQRGMREFACLYTADPLGGILG